MRTFAALRRWSMLFGRTLFATLESLPVLVSASFFVGLWPPAVLRLGDLLRPLAPPVAWAILAPLWSPLLPRGFLLRHLLAIALGVLLFPFCCARVRLRQLFFVVWLRVLCVCALIPCCACRILILCACIFTCFIRDWIACGWG